MISATLIWYIAAGFLIGWIASTLVEWFWFRRRRAGAGSGELPRPFPTSARRRLDEEPQEEIGADYRPFRTESVVQSSAQRENRPDDLSEIRGIGEVYRERLYAAGVFTWHQMASSDPESLLRAAKALPGTDTESWMTQAAELARAQGRIGATYSGPTPDTLTRIPGIDQVFEAALYRNGIFTFDSLAATTPERLSQLLPVEVVDDPNQFETWIQRARELRDSR